MFKSILLAILISAAPAGEASVSPAPQNVSIGNMSFNGDMMTFTKSENGAFECAIDGNSRMAIDSDGGNDIAITAQSIIIARDRNSKVTIRCSGDCRFSDSEHECSAERMEIQLKTQVTLQLSGGCRVNYGIGKDRTVIAGETITFEDSKFRVSGSASLQHVQ
jgi:hypothetical protein